jgi:hypothetical protein
VGTVLPFVAADVHVQLYSSQPLIYDQFSVDCTAPKHRLRGEGKTEFGPLLACLTM